ncbi:MAG: aldo/keto reductase [Polyangiaceae bacterium]|nr:aldo/keto reductase [Polyangiaceae bacterium]
MGTTPPSWARPRDPSLRPIIALGTMNFGKRTSEAEARRIIDRAIERGVTLFDTANAYVDGESERILGRALKGRRDRVAIATKVGFGRVAGKPEGLKPERVRAAIDDSLGRLATDHVDLYYLHVPDHDTPLAETLGAVGEILAAGKTRYFGVSNYASWQIVEIIHHCDSHSIARPVVAQQLYNLLIRQLDIEYFRFARERGLHTTVYNPLAGGLLTGRYHPGDEVARGSRFDGNRLYLGRYWSPRMIALAAEYEALAKEIGMTPVELAYAWLAAAPGVDSILVGPGSVEHLDVALDAVERALPSECRARIETIHRAFLGTETTYAR